MSTLISLLKLNFKQSNIYYQISERRLLPVNADCTHKNNFYALTLESRIIAPPDC